ncbi:hypothetical protein H4R33_003376 [Dimargaris cristalligena]|nr:hypothetical protein H4R33_003376 [Dimargaris cristalligena]
MSVTVSPSHPLQHPTTTTTPAAATATLYIAKAIYTFQGEHEDDLQFTRGDLISVRDCADPNWWIGSLINTERVGRFPSCLVRIAGQFSQDEGESAANPPPQAEQPQPPPKPTQQQLQPRSRPQSQQQQHHQQHQPLFSTSSSDPAIGSQFTAYSSMHRSPSLSELNLEEILLNLANAEAEAEGLPHKRDKAHPSRSFAKKDPTLTQSRFDPDFSGSTQYSSAGIHRPPTSRPSEPPRYPSPASMLNESLLPRDWTGPADRAGTPGGMRPLPAVPQRFTVARSPTPTPGLLGQNRSPAHGRSAPLGPSNLRPGPRKSLPASPQTPSFPPSSTPSPSHRMAPEPAYSNPADPRQPPPSRLSQNRRASAVVTPSPSVFDTTARAPRPGSYLCSTPIPHSQPEGRDNPPRTIKPTQSPETIEGDPDRFLDSPHNTLRTLNEDSSILSQEFHQFAQRSRSTSSPYFFAPSPIPAAHPSDAMSMFSQNLDYRPEIGEDSFRPPSPEKTPPMPTKAPNTAGEKRRSVLVVKNPDDVSTEPAREARPPATDTTIQLTGSPSHPPTSAPTPSPGGVSFAMQGSGFPISHSLSSTSGRLSRTKPLPSLPGQRASSRSTAPGPSHSLDQSSYLNPPSTVSSSSASSDATFHSYNQSVGSAPSPPRPVSGDLGTSTFIGAALESSDISPNVFDISRIDARPDSGYEDSFNMTFVPAPKPHENAVSALDHHRSVDTDNQSTQVDPKAGRESPAAGPNFNVTTIVDPYHFTSEASTFPAAESLLRSSTPLPGYSTPVGFYDKIPNATGPTDVVPPPRASMTNPAHDPFNNEQRPGSAQTCFQIVAASRPVVDLGPKALNVDQYNFARVDKYARNVKYTSTSITPDVLSKKYLTRPFETNLEKLRAIFIWIVVNISWDRTLAASPGDPSATINPESESANAVLQRRTCRQEGFANLFRAMVEAIDVDSPLVSGYVRGPLDQYEGNFFPGANQSWNVLRLESGEYRFIDCGAASLAFFKSNLDFNGTDRSQVRIDDFYFLTRPDHLVFTHYPTHLAHQFLQPPVALATFWQLPYIRGGYFRQNVKIQNFISSRVTLRNDDVFMLILKLAPDSMAYAEVEIPDKQGRVVDRIPGFTQCLNHKHRRLCKVMVRMRGENLNGILKVYVGSVRDALPPEPVNVKAKPRLPHTPNVIKIPAPIKHRGSNASLGGPTGGSNRRSDERHSSVGPIGTANGSPSPQSAAALPPLSRHTFPLAFAINLYHEGTDTARPFARLHLAPHEFYLKEPIVYELPFGPPEDFHVLALNPDRRHMKLQLVSPSQVRTKFIYQPLDQSYILTQPIREYGEWQVVYHTESESWLPIVSYYCRRPAPVAE